MNVLLNSAHQRKILKKWQPFLESGEPIKSSETKRVLAQIFENTYNQAIASSKLGLLGEAEGPWQGVARDNIIGKEPVAPGKSAGVLRGKTGYDGPGADSNFYTTNIVLPMLRRVFPDLIANELVSVQPLNGPIGFALAYRPVYNKDGYVGYPKKTDANDKEIGYYPVDAGYTGISADTSISSSRDPSRTDADEAWDAYLGKGDDRWNGFLGAGQDTTAAEYASLADGTYPTVSFGFITEAVRAKSRKLGAQWSPELAEDLQATQGLDVEQEMINLLSYEIGAEIDRQIVTEMVKAAITGGSYSAWDPSQADANDQMGRLATLLTHITIEANNIAIKTKRGAANFAITSPKICSLLQQLSYQKFISMSNSNAIPSVPVSGVGAIQKQGLINDGNQLLIRDAYSRGQYVLLGYKGAQKGDSGIIYCPYIPVQLTKASRPDTFTPTVGARTRYGILNNPWDAKNFYTMITIKGIDTEYSLTASGRYFVGETTDKNGPIPHMEPGKPTGGDPTFPEE